LREEFPDVTISKIRFLESRGLLDPERTPSGYRKFYEPDVDRLRWILRQQREHFLPLKVIKGRLENGMTDPDAPTPHLFEMGEPPPERQVEPVLVGAPEVAEDAHERAHAALSALAQLAASAAAPEPPTSLGDPVLLTSEAPPKLARDLESGPTGPVGRAGETRRSASAPGSSDGGPGPVTNSGQSRRRRAHGETDAVSAPERGGEDKTAPKAEPLTEERVASHGASRQSTTRSSGALPGASLSGASLTLPELAHASGLEMAGVEELESFGLIAGRTVAGVHCYDEEAVLVAKLAARFAPYGIEARHLKVFKHASDRQTGIYGQVVTPLLRQRNPEARARAIEELAELAELGEALMRCFTQATLRELTGG
jgi:DNA-binding transcriptional MerR regulator